MEEKNREILENSSEEEEGNSKIKIKITEMFFLFLFLGTFTIGGGFAMIPFIRREIIEKKGWLSDKSFLDNLAVAQSLPGPVVVNISLLTGYRLRGLKGGFFSLLGAIIPSFLIILTIAFFLWQYQDNHIVQAAFRGVRPVVPALIVSTIFKLGRRVFLGYRPLLLFLLFVCGLVFLNIHPVFIIISGAVIGLAWPQHNNNNSSAHEDGK